MKKKLKHLADKNVLLIGNYLSCSGQNMGTGEELAHNLRLLGWKVLTTSSQSNKLLRLVDMLVTVYFKRNEYSLTLVEVFSGPAFLWAYLSAMAIKLLGKPLILIMHGGNLPNFALKHPRCVARLLNSADVVTSPSSYLSQKMAIFRSSIHMIPNGLDVNRYSFRLRESPRPNLVWLRAFHQIYNPSLAPKVIKILNEQQIEFHLLMVGPDKEDGSLQAVLRTAQELGVADQIEIVRGVPKEQVPEILNRGDIFINTTSIDNTPVSVVEAMASGCCIVTTNVGGIPFLLEDGVDALLVPPDDAEAMAAAVKRLLTEPRLAESLSANARRKAEQFDWSKILPKWEKLFSDVMENVRI